MSDKIENPENIFSNDVRQHGKVTIDSNVRQLNNIEQGDKVVLYLMKVIKKGSGKPALGAPTAITIDAGGKDQCER
jgi:hypothetical protein